MTGYPCPVASDPLRKPVYGEIGHTIMSLLSDTRNFQYTIPQIDGVSIQIDGSFTKIEIPESQYDLMIKSLLTSNDYVFSLASLQFNDVFNSHLVAVENENLGSYSTKTVFNEIKNNVNLATGAAFVVFNGALKTNLALNAKQSIIEDGLMIQIDIETMVKLKQALQSMKPFRIDCFKSIQSDISSSSQSDNVISIEWVKEDRYLNKGVKSVIDGRLMTGVKSLRLTNTLDYVNETKSLRWTEIYLINVEEDVNSLEDNNFNLNRFADMVSQASCTALAPLLNDLTVLNQSYLNEKKISLKRY